MSRSPKNTKGFLFVEASPLRISGDAIPDKIIIELSDYSYSTDGPDSRSAFLVREGPAPGYGISTKRGNLRHRVK